jgi:hypothetical protein
MICGLRQKNGLGRLKINRKIIVGPARPSQASPKADKNWNNLDKRV